MKIAILALVILALSAAATKDASFDREVYKELDEELDELQTLMKEYENSSEESNSSKIDHCPVFTQNPDKNEDLAKRMIAATKPCGYYRNIGCTYEVIPANVVYPGEGPGELQYRPYIVQFDIGINQNIKNQVLSSYSSWGKGKRGCIGCGQTGEQCLEIIVKGGSDATGGCAGKCGPGCSIFGAGYAKDCMKHDVCATYKALKQRTSISFGEDDGYCYDPDCGDEAAQAIHNCFIANWWKDTPMICNRELFNKKNAYAWWSHATKGFTEGDCGNFQNWNSGQGIPDKGKIRNPY